MKYRFMVMEQFGEDIEKKFNQAGRRFGMKSVCHLALRLVSRTSFVKITGYVMTSHSPSPVGCVGILARV